MATSDLTSRQGIFKSSIELPNFTTYTLGRGVMDVTQLRQFNMYEKGYPFLVVLKIPEMFRKMGAKNPEYEFMYKQFVHVLEYDFRSLDGINNMSADTSEITNGNTKLDIITKVNWESASKFTMKYQERKGSLFARTLELYLRGIKDPTTQIKRWNGILPTDSTKTAFDSGYEAEVFEFMYFVTDNTARFIEKAFLLASCQFTEVQLDQYNQEKGQIEWQDVNLSFNGYAITNDLVTQKAQEFLDWLNNEGGLIVEQMKFAYKSLQDLNPTDQAGNSTNFIASRDFIDNIQMTAIADDTTTSAASSTTTNPPT